MLRKQTSYIECIVDEAGYIPAGGFGRARRAAGLVGIQLLKCGLEVKVEKKEHLHFL